MNTFTFLTHCTLCIATPLLFAINDQQTAFTNQEILSLEDVQVWEAPKSYDELELLLDNIGNGEAENIYSEHDLNKISAFIDEYDEGNNIKESQPQENKKKHKGVRKFFSKFWKKTKKFVAKHKKKILYTSSFLGTASTIAFISSTERGRKILEYLAPFFSIQSTLSSSDHEELSKKIDVDQKIGIQAGSEGIGLTFEEASRIISPYFAQVKKPTDNVELEIIEKDTTPILNFVTHLARGKKAHSCGSYYQAVDDYTTALNIKNDEPSVYYDRSLSYFKLGKYNESLNDFEAFTLCSKFHIQSASTTTIEFMSGFISQLPYGLYDAGSGFVVFAGNAATKPIHTIVQVYDSVKILVQLAREGELEEIGKAFSPEFHRLIREWDILSIRERGEQTGYAFGKCGGDFFTPAIAAKIAQKTIKLSARLCKAASKLKKAETTLILESAIENGGPNFIRTLMTRTKNVLSVAKKYGYTSTVLKQVCPTPRDVALLEEALKYLTLPAHQSRVIMGKAEKVIKGFLNEAYKEEAIRSTLHKLKIPTFPRPKGIPAHFVVRFSKKGAGIKYVSLEKPFTQIRVMPGKLHSPNKWQQRPYIVHSNDKFCYDKFGKIVAADSKAAHIPITEFKFKPFVKE